MDDFDRVWPRVNGMGPPPPPPPGGGEAKELAALIRMESKAAQRYSAMASRTNGKAALTLKRLAAGSRGLVKKMQREYYLRTGDTLFLSGERFKSRGLQEDLRRAWLDAREGEKAYLNAAANTRDPELRALYGNAAELKQRQQREIKELTGRLFR